MAEMAAAQAQLAQMKMTGVGICGPKVYVDVETATALCP
jgi:hypothetical protein